MTLNVFKHRWLKVLLIVLAVLVILVLIPALFLNSYLEPKLSAKLKTTVENSSDSLYHINFSDIKLNILQGRATLYNVTLKPDQNIYRQKKKQGIAPDNLYQLQLNRLVISGAKAFDLYFNKKLVIGKIALNNPKIVVSKYAQKADTGKKDDRTLYQKISASLKSVRIGEINLTGINYQKIDYTGAKPTKSELNQMDVKATNLLIDSASQTDTSRFLFCKDITTKLNDYTSKSADGLYTFKVKSAQLSTQTKRLTVSGLSLIPAERTTFFKKSKSDRFIVHLENIVLNDFDYLNYQKTQSIDIKKMVIDKGDFEVFGNYNGALKTTDRLVTFPHWAIRHKLKMQLNIDTLDLKHMNFTYSQLNKTSNKFGHVKFTKINGRFLNMTNRKQDLAKNNICTANITSYFMGKGKLSLQFTFNLNDATYNYAYKGHMGPMDMQIVNPVLMPLAMVKINSGKVNSFDFNVHSTQKTSKGTVSFLYTNLNVDILRADYTKKTLISTLANTVIIKHDNPDDGETKPRMANVVYIRPANFPFFKTIWHVLLNGIKNCAGIGPAQEKKLNSQQDTEDKKEQEKIIKKAVEEKKKEDKKFKEQVKEKKEGKKT
ncbi:hypothetical protein ACFQZX_13160 [Mucilaginibacter litoreus]|uniref:AsmA-like C-terminal region n=1 Tax=Mucilaginibacter litoreus TaxID=1048221 RepID=A0ABW3AU40_9SPHI